MSENMVLVFREENKDYFLFQVTFKISLVRIEFNVKKRERSATANGTGKAEMSKKFVKPATRLFLKASLGSQLQAMLSHQVRHH